MHSSHKLTRHAQDRTTARSIPPGIAEMILEYGASHEAGNGTWKFGLSSKSMSLLRRRFGPEFTKVLEPYRRRGAYVVATSDTIITVAFADKPLFH